MYPNSRGTYQGPHVAQGIPGGIRCWLNERRILGWQLSSAFWPCRYVSGEKNIPGGSLRTRRRPSLRLWKMRWSISRSTKWMAAISSRGTRVTPAISEIRGTNPSKMPWNRRVPNSASCPNNGTLAARQLTRQADEVRLNRVLANVYSRRGMEVLWLVTRWNRDLSLGKWPPDLYTEPRWPSMLLAQR